MSVDYNIYVGPLVRCTAIKLVPSTIRACNTSGCSSRGYGGGGGNFCNMCGKPYQQVQKGTHEEVDWYDVVRGAMQSKLSPNGEVRIFVPNVHRNDPREFQFDLYDDVYSAVVPEQIKAEREWFMVAFAPEIARLREAYGDTNVLIEWAIFSWTS